MIQVIRMYTSKETLVNGGIILRQIILNGEERKEELQSINSITKKWVGHSSVQFNLILKRIESC